MIKDKKVVRQERIKWLKESNIPILMGITLVLACLFAFTLAKFLATPPSEGISREVELASVVYGDSKIVKSHLYALQDDDKQVTTIAVDGHNLRVLTVDIKGKVSRDASYTLDLYKSKQVLPILANDGLVVYHIENHLYKSVIDYGSGQVTTEKISEDIKSLRGDAKTLIVEKSDGLYMISEELKWQLIPLNTSKIISYDVSFSDDLTYIALTEENGFVFNFRVIVIDDSMTIVDDFMIEEETREGSLKYISDVYYEDKLLTTLTVEENQRDGLNYVFLSQLDMESGEMLKHFDEGFPILNSRFTISHASLGSGKVLLQRFYRGGTNIVEATIEEGSRTNVRPLTKTKKNKPTG